MDEKEDSSGTGQKEGDNSIDELLDTSKAERATWLLKCPHLIYTSLQSPPDDSDPSRPVAKVVLSVDPLHSNDDNSATEFTMELMAGTEPGNLPKSYSMDTSSEDLVPMLVFSESSQGKCCVEGKILNKLGVRPRDKDIDNYGKLFRERLNKYKAKSRQIQVISNEDAGVRMTPMPGMFRDTKIMAAKRCRRDRSEMEEIMFKLFERQPNWTLKQLIQETDQPKRFLRDLLKDLCVFNDKGSNKGSYELKPQYKVNKLE